MAKYRFITKQFPHEMSIYNEGEDSTSYDTEITPEMFKIPEFEEDYKLFGDNPTVNMTEDSIFVTFKFILE